MGIRWEYLSWHRVEIAFELFFGEMATIDCEYFVVFDVCEETHSRLDLCDQNPYLLLLLLRCITLSGN